MTPTVLTFILDDDPTVMEFVDRLLNKEGRFKIFGFTDPNNFKAALTRNVNLVLLDINIPGHDYDVEEMITYLHNEFPGIYVIIISGYFTLERAFTYWNMGAFAGVDKNALDWQEKLRDALDRVITKIFDKIEAINK